jgi:hypothetical protein
MLQDSKHALKTFRNDLFTGVWMLTFGIPSIDTWYSGTLTRRKRKNWSARRNSLYLVLPRLKKSSHDSRSWLQTRFDSTRVDFIPPSHSKSTSVDGVGIFLNMYFWGSWQHRKGKWGWFTSEGYGGTIFVFLAMHRDSVWQTLKDGISLNYQWTGTRLTTPFGISRNYITQDQKFDLGYFLRFSTF